ncbi:hypothetical protein [Dehalococcoides mccartyi]|jgi:hypothetical protein|uniref:hypothetical protein n=1 Tax=Dehalococcoides mccartyi TaxID=61435 RepID=UPI00098ECD71|nr:hypothetical protein [Dehalococcoides mccartyi]AQU06091.1 hypothetical protein B1777_05250 [Dehalococcoides mccartyi]AQU07534.1 hypothetical protein B1778_05050 [Dehalococcoides mccartyi]AQX74780.1 hypothetical protein B1776_04345 [Dehalococcoides mccartyi]AQY73357.1 hypothetical protein B1772_04655 [Dehalococcoides mccartyi]QBX64057.1 hypothetical protein DhcFL2_04680 [Dehalococcoides mccartyi]
MTPSLANINPKLQRAKEHLDSLLSQMSSFIQNNPPRVVIEEDQENHLCILKTYCPKIDTRFGIIVGEFTHNLRSSLDNLVWQLALSSTHNPNKHICFPVSETNDPDTRKLIKYSTCGIHPEAIKLIETLQPYNDGDNFKQNSLWKLNKLWNIDKHRVIPNIGTVLDSYIPKDVKPIKTEVHNGIVYVWLPISVMTKMTSAPSPIFDIQFGSKDDGLVLNYTDLRKIYTDITVDIIPQFERFFSHSKSTNLSH